MFCYLIGKSVPEVCGNRNSGRRHQRIQVVQMQSAKHERSWTPELVWDPDVKKFLEGSLGKERLKVVSESLTRPPLLTCIRVNRLKSTVEEVLEALPRMVGTEEDAILMQEYPPFKHPIVPWAIIVRGTGPCMDIDYDQAQEREVIVGRLAGESMLKGAQGYAPGILAYTAGIEQGDVVAVSVGVEIDERKTKFGCTRGSILERPISLDDGRFPDRSRMFIGIGTCETNKLNPSSKGLAVKMRERVFRLPSLGDGLLAGKMMLQSLPSLVAAVTLDPKPGSRVLDMCAAPGGKTMALAEIMDNRGEIIAFDRSHTKVRGIRELADDLGIQIVRAIKADSTTILQKGKSFSASKLARELNEKERRRADRIRSQKAQRGESITESAREEVLRSGFDEKYFDHVLLDAPCSALGLRPRLSISHDMEELRKASRYQKRFIDTAVHLVKDNGTMVYSTCTINPLENERNVRYILDEYPFMKLEKSACHIGGPGLTGTINYMDRKYQLLRPEEAELVQRFDPDYKRMDTMGFFIAKFRRVG